MKLLDGGIYLLHYYLWSFYHIYHEFSKVLPTYVVAYLGTLTHLVDLFYGGMQRAAELDSYGSISFPLGMYEDSYMY